MWNQCPLPTPAKEVQDGCLAAAEDHDMTTMPTPKFRKTVIVLHEDIIEDSFWIKHPNILT